MRFNLVLLFTSTQRLHVRFLALLPNRPASRKPLDPPLVRIPGWGKLTTCCSGLHFAALADSKQPALFRRAGQEGGCTYSNAGSIGIHASGTLLGHRDLGLRRTVSCGVRQHGLVGMMTFWSLSS